MKVQCSLCEFESGGFCSKKTQSGKPIKIKTNKKRLCSSYSEDSTRVLKDYRKKEAHKRVLRIQEAQRAQMASLIQGIKDGTIDLSKQTEVQ